MNFEAKHWIRWGIAGWVYLSAILAYFTVKDLKAASAFIFSYEVSTIVASATIFILAGIILGHLIHQVSIGLGFIIWTQQAKYFRSEYEIDKIIIKNHRGGEIQRIYSYRLGNLHALRALFTSLAMALTTVIFLAYAIQYSTAILVLLIILFVLFVIVFINYRYFYNNFNYFVANILIEFQSK
ncbi:BA5345 family protein [Peribacillus glennii]|uniref:Uncharacterized protein n=1 Tax=Peribacillus glennii TaxID=2303991 RepID=A0A372LFJ7_9BACI|nr:hypothetical protein [Peribacillus glennii]RFU65027.1 hypothetical protein D0466_03695 [Peribacillus glennii]